MAPDSEKGKWNKPRNRRIRRGTGTWYRKGQSIKFLLSRDRKAVLSFLTASYPFSFPIRHRVKFLRDLLHVTHQVRGYHTLTELLTVCDRIFRIGDQENIVVIEAGAGSGSSTAKLSLATRIVGGQLYVFDTFRGIPENDEQHHLLDGRPLKFVRGAFKGRLAAVKKRVETYGAPEVCHYTKGLFEDTLPSCELSPNICLIDVDLILSTRTCLEHFAPKMKPGGVIFSQDGHLRATIDLLEDEAFWDDLLEQEKPNISGLESEKLIEIQF